MNALQEKYLAEVEHRLRRAGFEAGPEYNGLLPIKKDAHQLCTINMHGGMSYAPDFVRKNGQEDVLDQARHIAVETLTYMRQMASAPLLTAEGFVSNPKQEKLLEQIMEQIEGVVPEVIDLANELTQYPKQHELGGMEQI